MLLWIVLGACGVVAFIAAIKIGRELGEWDDRA